MTNIRIMEAKVGTINAEVDVPFFDSTFLPEYMLGDQHRNIHSLETGVRALMDQAQTDTEYKDYTRYAAVLKWAKTCGGAVKNVSLLNDGNGKYIRITFLFFDVNSFIEFNKDFRNSVKGGSI